MQETPICVNLEEKIQEGKDRRGGQRSRQDFGRDRNRRRDRGNQGQFRNNQRRERFQRDERRYHDNDAPWSHDLFQQDQGYKTSDNRDNRRRAERSQRLTRVNITSLHYSVTSSELRELGERYGQVREVKIDWDNMGRSNETGYIEYANETDARNAVEQLDGVKVESLPMKCVLTERPDNERNQGQDRFNRDREGFDRKRRNFRNRNDDGGIRRRFIRKGQ